MDGVLRETAERVLEDRGERLSGDRDKGDRPNKPGMLRFAGQARLTAADRAFFSANQDARAALFSRLGSIGITAEGVADDDTLRTAEVAVPMTLVGRVDWAGAGPPDDSWDTALDQLCRLTFAFGHGKMDGLGRVLVSASRCNDSPGSQSIDAKARNLTIDLYPDDEAVFSRLNANFGQ